MKKGHIIELVIDTIIVVIGLALSILAKPSTKLMCALVFLALSILEIIEYFFNKDRKEALFISIAAVVSFAIILLLNSKLNLVLAYSTIAFSISSLVTKVYSLVYIKKERTNFFVMRYIIIGVFSLLAIFTSIALYYHVLTNMYLVSLLIMCFGLQELFCDMIMYIDELREIFKR